MGEAHRPEAFQALFRGVGASRYEGAEISDDALISDDRHNPHDRNALAVFVKGQHVGYLERALARDYRPAVNELTTRGQVLQVPARTWASLGGERVHARVTIWLPPPTGVLPQNDLPAEAHTVLPPGGAVQVTKEDEHMDVLAPLLARDRERALAVTLHAIHEIRPRSSYETVEIRIDGLRVGILTRTQATNMLQLVKYVAERNLIAVSRAVLKGSPLKADVVLNIIKASEVDHEWLESLGPPAVRQSDDRPPVRPAPEWDD